MAKKTRVNAQSAVKEQQRGHQLNLFGGAGSAPKPNAGLPENLQEYAHKLLMQHFAEDRNEVIKFNEIQKH